MTMLTAERAVPVPGRKRSLLGIVGSLISRDVTVLLRGSGAMASLGFFLMAGCLAPLALGSDPALLRGVAPGLVWILAVLSALISLDSLFQEDLADGTLATLRLTPVPLAFVALAKAAAYWLTVCLPLTVAAPIIIFLLGGEDRMAWLMFISLLVGTPALVLLGGALAAICAGLKRGTGLMILLALPLFTPALIFGTRVLSDGVFNPSALYFLAAYSFFAMALCPFAMEQALKQYME